MECKMFYLNNRKNYNRKLKLIMIVKLNDCKTIGIYYTVVKIVIQKGKIKLEKYIKETPMLNYSNQYIKQLIKQKKWRNLEAL